MPTYHTQEFLFLAFFGDNVGPKSVTLLLRDQLLKSGLIMSKSTCYLININKRWLIFSCIVPIQVNSVDLWGKKCGLPRLLIMKSILYSSTHGMKMRQTHSPGNISCIQQSQDFKHPSHQSQILQCELEPTQPCLCDQIHLICSIVEEGMYYKPEHGSHILHAKVMCELVFMLWVQCGTLWVQPFTLAFPTQLLPNNCMKGSHIPGPPVTPDFQILLQ